MNYAVSCGILEPIFRGADSLIPNRGALNFCADFNSDERPLESVFRPSITPAAGDGLPKPAATAGQNPPPRPGVATLAFGDPLQPVFVRLPRGTRRVLLDGTELNFWQIRRLISKVPGSKDSPPVRGYVLRQTGAERGIVLIESADLRKWWNECFRRSGIFTAPVPIPQIPLPPVLHIPPPGKDCPYTSLKHTTMFELSRPFSPYGQTQIYVTRYLLPGSAAKVIAIETHSLLRFIRSLPAPQYKMPSGPPQFLKLRRSVA